ncbi:protein YhfH [Bacillus taeanensis]|uniref:YhfH family protein n=1 Tax=Bacillus taeanensis TaxID=273032 RepID=A0A366XLY4_9BACI|nr:protein YhfH [Bacillus taeanensis]RBW67380.1 YhfH family protein [Bacillus taeanensis]
MIQKSTEFFRNLPAKQCTKCGNKMKEQHESYSNECEDCARIDYTL